MTPVPEPMTPVPEPEIPVTVPPADDNPPQVMTMPPAANDPPTIVTPPNTGLDVNVVSSKTMDKCNLVVRTISDARATSFQILEQRQFGTVAKALAYLAIWKYSPHH